MGFLGGLCVVGVGVIFDLIVEVLVDILIDQVKGMVFVEVVVEVVLLYVGLDMMFVFQGFCFGWMVNFLERRLLCDEEEYLKKFDKNRFGLLLFL